MSDDTQGSSKDRVEGIATNMRRWLELTEKRPLDEYRLDRDAVAQIVARLGHEPPAVTWPQSKGNPFGPVWSYGGKKGMYQAEALRMMAHDLVDRIKWLEAEPRAVLKQAQDIDGVDTFALIKALHRTIDGQRKHVAALEKARAAQPSRPDVEAITAVPQLKDKRALVLYFHTDADRDEFVTLIHAAKPGMRSVKL